MNIEGFALLQVSLFLFLFCVSISIAEKKIASFIDVEMSEHSNDNLDSQLVFVAASVVNRLRCVDFPKDIDRCRVSFEEGNGIQSYSVTFSHESSKIWRLKVARSEKMNVEGVPLCSEIFDVS